MTLVQVLPRRIRGISAGALVLAVAAGLLGTVFGLGALGQAPEIFDGSAWLWSRPVGEVARVNGDSGTVDLRQPLVDSRGHRIRITQNDNFLLLHDLETGRVTSVDLARMGFSGSLALDPDSDVVVLLSGQTATVVDRTRGLVRPLDPATLQARGEPLQLPAPLVGGAYDASGALWLGIPGQGTVVAVTSGTPDLVVSRTVPVAAPGSDLAISVLDNGVLAIDRGGDRMMAVAGRATHEITSPVKLAGATAPDRTEGRMAVVTAPAARSAIAIEDVNAGGPVHKLSLPATAQTAVPFANRIYVPDEKAGLVRVYDIDGTSLQPITVPESSGPLELLVREKRLFVNAVDSPTAIVVDEQGRSNEVDKFGPGAAVPNPTVSAPPATTPPRTSKPTTTPPADPPRTTTPPADPPRTTPPPADPTRTTPPPAPPTTTTAPSTDDPQPPGASPSPTGDPDGPGDPTTPPPEAPGPPGVPVPVTVLAGDQQVQVSWGRSALTGGAPVRRYVITYQGGDDEGRVTVDGDTLSTVVTGLRNGTTYQFRVTAENEYGSSPPALSAPVTPVGAAPPAAPGAPTATAAPGRVTVTWSAVDGAREYVVRPLRDGEAGVNPPQTVTGLTTEFEGLTPGVPYTFTVAAVGSDGSASPPSAPSNQVVPFTRPGAPRTVAAERTNGTTYRITWGAAADNGRAVEEYVVRDGAGAELGRTPGDGRALTVTRSAALTEVAVSAVNEAGEGPAATAKVSQPVNLTVRITEVEVGDDDVIVHFTVGNTGGGSVTCTVEVGSQRRTGCGGEVEVTGLRPETTYTVTVTAAAGGESASDKKTVTTYPSGMRGNIHCHDNDFCDGGAPIFDKPDWDLAAAVGHNQDDYEIWAVCKQTSDTVKGTDLGGLRDSNLWIFKAGGHWVPYAFVSLDGDIAALTTCR